MCQISSLMTATEGPVAEFSSFADFEERKRKSSLLMSFPKKVHQKGSFGQIGKIPLLNRAAVGWAVSCSAFGLFFFNRAAVGVRGSSFTWFFFFFNRAAIGWAVYPRQAVYF